jgi:hypothetical protein
MAMTNGDLPPEPRRVFIFAAVAYALVRLMKLVPVLISVETC